MNEPSDARYARAAIAEPTAPDDAPVPATPKDSCSVEWLDQLAVVTLPDHIDVSNVSHIGKKLLLVINRGASALIADMTATVSCDHASADAMVRACQQALAIGTPLRLMVPARAVQRMLTLDGLDPLVPVSPSLAAAIAAGIPATAVPVMPKPGSTHAAQRLKPDRTTRREEET